MIALWRNEVFNKEKTAQIAAYFLWKCGEMQYLKLMKLMYLAERKYLIDYGARLTGDRLVSMKYGPVLSNTLDLMRFGDFESTWDSWIKDEADKKVSASKRIESADDFDLLSVAIIETLDNIIENFGSVGTWDLVALTHKKDVCPEWQDPHDSSFPIDIEDILFNAGKTKQEVNAIVADLSTQDEYQRLIGDMR